jgi:ABC-type nitrate/sulfonate/bicarbonate transport system substrate-binding protein
VGATKGIEVHVMTKAMKRLRSRFLTSLLLAGLVVMVAAGSAQPRTATRVPLVASQSGSTQAVDHLKFAFPSYATTTMLTYIAAANRYFSKLGLAVDIQDGVAANTTVLLVSGQVDIVSQSYTVPLSQGSYADQGPVIVHADTGGGNAGLLVGSPKTAPTLAALQAKKGNCRLGTFALGSTTYGYAQIYNQTFQCKIFVYGSVPIMLSALVAGSIDAFVTSYPSSATSIDAGQVNILVDTRVPATRRQWLPSIFETCSIGLSDNLKKKRPAVVKWLKGVNLARKWLKAHNDQQVTAILQKFGQFAAMDPATLQKSVGATRSYLGRGSTNGYLTRGQWAQGLKVADLFGIPGYHIDNAQNAYDKRVDMSYYIAAIGKPRGG